MNAGLERSDFVTLRGRVTVVGLGPERALVRGAGTSLVLDGVPVERVRRVLSLVDGHRDVGAICTAAADQGGEAMVQGVLQRVSSLLEVRRGERVEPEARASERHAAQAPGGLKLAVIGNGSLARTFHERLRSGGFSQCVLYDARSFSSCTYSQFMAQWSEATVGDGHGREDRPASAPVSAEEARHVTEEVLHGWLKEADFAICALEHMPYQAFLDVSAAASCSGTPCLFVSVSGRQVLVGPTFLPGWSACFACSRLQVEFGHIRDRQALASALAVFESDALEEGWGSAAAEAAAVAVLREAQAVSAENPKPTLLMQVLRLLAEGGVRPSPVSPGAECPTCAGRSGPSAQTSGRAAALEGIASAQAALSHSSALSRFPLQERRSIQTEYKRIGIIGGGTAGYLSALAFRRLLPHLEVTLIESSDIPIIGVGEATTPDVVLFLHWHLGLDINRFYAEVAPTWKFGIRFEWGQPGDYFFNYPFEGGQLLESLLYEGDINKASISSMLMAANRVPIVRTSESTYLSLLSRHSYAYHLDNRRFVRYLQGEARRQGVREINSTISHAVMSADGEEVDHLVAVDGRKFEFDLYVDCSGFRSLLMEKAMGSRFVGYERSLFTDSAMVGPVPHGGNVRPYTTAQTMDNGWCWSISHAEEDHRGYVFSSAFCSPDKAAAEMRARHPNMKDLSLVRFRVGRHEHCWKGNVLAVGNSYGFVEPLESSGLHMIVMTLTNVLSQFPATRAHAHQRQHLNEMLNQYWDRLRWFLALHYKFNRNRSTPFWRECQENAEVTGARDVIELFEEMAPLSYRPHSLRLPDIFQDYGRDVLLLGQNVPGRLMEPIEGRASWDRKMIAARQLVDRCISHKEALEVTSRSPSMLEDFMRQEGSWGQRLIGFLNFSGGALRF